MPTLTTNTNTIVAKVKGKTHVHCSGTFGGGTITWRYLGDDSAYHDLAEGALAVAGDKKFDLPDDIWTQIRGTLAGATAPSLYYDVRARQTRKE